MLSEGVVIVASILLAFGLQAWWDQTQERKAERETLEGLRTDFEWDLRNLDGILAAHGRWESAGAHLDSLSRLRDATVPPDSVGPYLSALLGRRTFDSQGGTLEALIASGGLGLLANPELRALLVRWQRSVRDLEEEATSFWSASERVVDRLGALGGPWSQMAAMGPRDYPELAEERNNFPSVDPTHLMDRELMDLLRIKRYWSIFYRSQLMGVRSLAEEVFVLVQAELG